MVRWSIVTLFLASLIASVPTMAAPKGGGSQHEVFVDAPNKLSPDAKAGLRVAVYKSTGVLQLEPVGGAQVDIVLVASGSKETHLYSGKTEATGTLGATFTVPDLPDGDYTMEVRTKSANGTHTSKQPVKIRREHRILLVTDKPLYQPAQTIHLRALAVGDMSLKPASGAEVHFEIEDPKGNKVFKRKTGANDFGVASCDFNLADEISMGDYKITATVGTSRTEKSVTVKKYVLPKFKTVVKTEKSFYLPLETIKGTLQVDYFFGKPVKDGTVVVKASTFDVQFREFGEAKTKTDAKGSAEFEIKLPDYFVGQPLEKGNAFVQLEISVIDTADHEEKVTKTLSVANSLIQLNAVPESGKLVPGIENILYVLATAPDGSAVVADVTMRAGGVETKGTTNESGFAALKFKPEEKSLRAHGQDVVLDVTVSAKDKQGNTAVRTLPLSSEYGRDQMLLRLDKAIYQAGETVQMEMFATFDTGMVFLDAVRGGQTALTSTCQLAKGRASYKLTLPLELFGSVELHAYKILANGEIARDTRVIYVQPPQELQIAIAPDKNVYAPAEDAKIAFRVTDKTGKPVQAALGVIIVDEAVYALQDMQPGLEKVYFTLAKELQEPKYGIKVGTSMPELISEAETKKQEVAKILLAPAAPGAPRWQENTYAMKLAKFDEQLEQIYWAMYYHIVNDKATFFETLGGKRDFKNDLLDELLKGKSYKLPKECLVDPWGNKVTLDDLGKLSRSFQFEHWAKIMSLRNLQQIWQNLATWVVENDAVAWDGGGWILKSDLLDKLGLPKETLSDYFGERYTVDRLPKEDEAFSAENLAILTREQRKIAIFNFLRQGGVTDAELAKKAFARKPSGGIWTLDELAKEHAAFTKSNLDRIANVERRKGLYDALVAKMKKSGFGEMATFDRVWAWKSGIVDTLIREKFLTETQASDISGNRFVIDDIVKEDAQFSPATFLAGVHFAARQKIDNMVCSQYHSGNKALPEDPIQSLVDAKHLKSEDVVDAWGTQLRLAAATVQRPSTMGCGMLSGRWTVVSAGPDKKFDTDDDLNVGGTASAGQYYANYANCVFYQQQQPIRGLTHGPSAGEDEELALGAPRKEGQFGAGGGGSRDRGKLANKPASLRKMDEKKKSMDGLDKDHNESGNDDEGGGPIRVREYFPETLFWNPSIITDENGCYVLPVTMADSITSWRLTASANSKSGLLGSTTHQIIVFQDFFVDIDLPVALTQNDSVSIPIAVYNYLKEDQTVRLTMEKGDWFELQGEPKQEVALKAGQVKAVYYKIKVKKIGRQALTVEARGGRGVGDAIKRTIEIVPDGKMYEAVINDRLSPKIVREIVLPDAVIDDSYKIFVKVYPGVFSQMMEGVEGMLGMPHG